MVIVPVRLILLGFFNTVNVTTPLPFPVLAVVKDNQDGSPLVAVHAHELSAAVIDMLALPPVHSADWTFISAPNRVDMVHDPIRNFLYITSGGQVLQYDLKAQQFLSPYQLGGNLKGIDVSPDAQTLAVADNGQTGIVLIDLSTGYTKRVAFTPASSYEEGTFSVAYGNDGNIFQSIITSNRDRKIHRIVCRTLKVIVEETWLITQASFPKWRPAHVDGDCWCHLQPSTRTFRQRCLFSKDVSQVFFRCVK